MKEEAKGHCKPSRNWKKSTMKGAKLNQMCCCFSFAPSSVSEGTRGVFLGFHELLDPCNDVF